MKIAIYHNLPPGGNKRALHDTVRGMKASGHTVDVHTLSISEEGFKPLREVADRVITHAVGALRMQRAAGVLATLPSLRRVNRRIAEQLNRSDADVIWVANCYLTQHPFVLRYLRRPVLLYTAEHLRHYYDYCWASPPEPTATGGPGMVRRLVRRAPLALIARVDRTNLAAARNVLVNSCFTRENLLRYYGKDSTVVSPGVDLDRFRPLAIERDDVVLSVGGLSPVKGHDTVIRSLAHVPAARRPRLVVVADRVEGETQRRRLEQLAATSGVNLEIRLQIDEDALVVAYNRAKATVCANVLEPFGLVPLESMACGTPVIAVREGGLRESVRDGETGYLVDRDETALGAAIDAVIGDDALRRCLGTQGVALAGVRFGLSRYWEQVERQVRAVALRGELDRAWTSTP
ncbi:MAG TPA: glycosyltransferase family 4 protein [Candidatus Binatia bacterium]|nr:glycosyltransferase family 4 protein [Candidatus Binatia bacterium]